MAAQRSANNATPRSATHVPDTGNAAAGFTDDERAALRDRAEERTTARRSRTGGARDESDERAVLAKIAGMAPADRALGERLHALITTTAPGLAPKLWYGMPAYAKDGKVVCFFQDARKFKTRYATLGFSDAAALDEGQMWPTAFALQGLTGAEEARIGALVTRAVSG